MPHYYTLIVVGLTHTASRHQPKTRPSRWHDQPHQVPYSPLAPAVCWAVPSVSDPTGERPATPDTNAAESRYHRVPLGYLELRNLFTTDIVQYRTGYCQPFFTPHLHCVFAAGCNKPPEVRKLLGAIVISSSPYPLSNFRECYRAEGS